MDKIMLTISSLKLGYGETTVLTLPSLHIAKGEQCLITGPSGSGKTTLFYAIAGLLNPTSGTITIHNTDITQLTESQRDRFRGKHIGIIFQTLHLVKSLTVEANLQLASYAAGIPHDIKRADAILNQLGIAHKKSALPNALSQGQAQRAAIARAVLHNPALILADDPTSSLDDESCESAITLIKQMAQQSGATLIISTHDNRVKPHFSRVIAL